MKVDDTNTVSNNEIKENHLENDQKQDEDEIIDEIIKQFDSNDSSVSEDTDDIIEMIVKEFDDENLSITNEALVAQQKYTCDKCDKILSTKSNLRAHVKTVHKDIGFQTEKQQKGVTVKHVKTQKRKHTNVSIPTRKKLK